MKDETRSSNSLVGFVDEVSFIFTLALACHAPIRIDTIQSKGRIHKLKQLETKPLEMKRTDAAAYSTF
jgi:hypothetical protein